MTQHSKITIDAIAVKFFVGLSDCTQEAECQIAVYKEAVKRAYGDMSRHTLIYTAPEYQGNTKWANENKENLKAEIAKYLKNEEKRVLGVQSECAYDRIHEELCKMVSDIFTSEKTDVKDKDGNDVKRIPLEATPQPCDNPETKKKTFSMGQAQKVVNMVWKYVYLFYEYYHAADNRLFDAELKQFDKVIPFLHAPVDGFVIEAATKKNPKYLDKRIDKPASPWSQLNYEEYMKFQRALREELKKQDEFPFLWELENWPFPDIK